MALVLVPAPLAAMSRPLVTVPLVLLTLTLRASAAPDWLTMAAVAAVPVVPLTVRPVTLPAVGVTVFCAVAPGTCTRQSVQVLAEVALTHVGRALAPLETRTCPALPVPAFWSEPVEVVPPVSRPYAVVEERPVPPWATLTAVKPAPNAPAVKVPVPVMLVKVPGVRDRK